MALTEIQLKTCRFHGSLSQTGSRPLRYTNREIVGVMQPKIRLRFPGTCDIFYFRTNCFWLPDVHF